MVFLKQVWIPVALLEMLGWQGALHGNTLDKRRQFEFGCSQKKYFLPRGLAVQTR